MRKQFTRAGLAAGASVVAALVIVAVSTAPAPEPVVSAQVPSRPAAQAAPVGGAVTLVRAAAPTAIDAVQPPVGDLLAQLEQTAGGQLMRTVAEDGRLTFLRAPRGAVLARDAEGSAEVRAQRFLSEFGSLLGLSAAERAALSNAAGSDTSTLRVRAQTTDALGETHVRLAQEYRGLPVLGGELVVHLTDEGVSGVNGHFVPDLALSASPALASEDAFAAAARGTAAQASQASLAVYPRGLLEGGALAPVLAWAVEVSGKDFAEQVWVDATTGEVLNRIARQHSALDRTIYSPQYDPANPDLFVQRRESEAPSLVPMVNNLYDFAGETYNLYASAFGRDSFDGEGGKMISVYLVNEVCPNAYWDSTSTNYCPGFDLDDVVSHEWSHAYTEHTHGLIYSYQSGALNESYSDIFGELVDLLNGKDGLGGANNAAPYPAGQRWLVGEDLTDPVVTLLFRDMWDPERLGYPAKVSSANYYCGTGDGGGVHTNSSVSNNAFSMLADGKTFNGVTVPGIGLTRAAAIYFRAADVYQTPSSNFVDHADALEASCTDLIGAPLANLSTASAAGTLSSELITSGDCDQLRQVISAVELRAPPSQCGYAPLLAKTPPAQCTGATPVFSEDWETGTDGWTTETSGVAPEYPNYLWTTVGGLPLQRAGSAVFAIDDRGGTCVPGGDHSGRFSLTSQPFTASASTLELRFDHLVETEALYDGGNLRISVNGGPFTVVPQSAFLYNAPNGQLDAAAPVGQNTNPKAGEWAWNGADEGDTRGSWGTTVVSLRSLVKAGDTFRLQFDFGVDGCNGVTGWFVDDLSLYSCPAGATAAPSASFTAPSSAQIVSQVPFDASASRDNDEAGGSIVSYTWDFGDGLPASTTTTPRTTHAFLLPGTYTVRLTVTDNEGETATAARTIRISLPLLPASDLQVTSVTAGPERDVTSLTAVVVNNGNLLSLPSRTEFLVNGVSLGRVSTPSIPAGGATAVSLPWSVSGLKGEQAVTVRADREGTNPELDETNNVFDRRFRITGRRVK